MSEPWRSCLEASVWRCNAECECVEPQIDLLIRQEGPWVKRVPVWRGEFHSDQENEIPNQVAALRKEAERRGIVLDEYHFGRRILSESEANEIEREVGNA